MRPIEPVRLIVVDVDGVLTDGEAQPWNLAPMAGLAALNRAARRDSHTPAVGDSPVEDPTLTLRVA